MARERPTREELEDIYAEKSDDWVHGPARGYIDAEIEAAIEEGDDDEVDLLKEELDVLKEEQAKRN